MYTFSIFSIYFDFLAELNADETFLNFLSEFCVKITDFLYFIIFSNIYNC